MNKKPRITSEKNQPSRVFNSRTFTLPLLKLIGTYVFEADWNICMLLLPPHTNTSITY